MEYSAFITCNQEYFNLLPSHIKKQFTENMYEEGNDLKEYLFRDGDSCDFIDMAFNWGGTPQGNEYWSYINELFKNQALDITPEDFRELYDEHPEHSVRDQIINTYDIY